MSSHPSNEIKTRILILSDTHSALPYPETDNQSPYRWPLPKADILLHAGDLTSNGSLLQHQRALELISTVEADLKIVIPGNHDVTLDDPYYQRHPNRHCSWPKYSGSQLQEIKDLYANRSSGEGIEYIGRRSPTVQVAHGSHVHALRVGLSA